MTELYNFSGIGRIEASARYASYRRFEVSVGTTEVLPLVYGPEVAEPEGADSPPPDSLPSAEPPPPLPPTTTAELEMMPTPEPVGAIGTLLRKAGDYVVRYEEAFRNVLAVEDSDQQYDEVVRKTSFARKPDGHVTAHYAGDTRRTTRKLRSEIAFAMLPGPVPWTAFREVFEVDGRAVGERGRFERLFRESPSSGVQPALAISRDSHRYGLGFPNRGASVPTMALAFLHPDNRDRFTFEPRSRRAKSGNAAEVAFTEVGRPTLTLDGAGADLPARGRLLLREDDGAVLRTEVEFRSAGSNGRSLRVTTEYRPDSGLALLAPAEMKEVYETAADAEAGWGGGGTESPRPTPTGDRLETTARYSGFHRVGPGSRP
jgi:hypothetical protein